MLLRVLLGSWVCRTLADMIEAVRPGQVVRPHEEHRGSIGAGAGVAGQEIDGVGRVAHPAVPGLMASVSACPWEAAVLENVATWIHWLAAPVLEVEPREARRVSMVPPTTLKPSLVKVRTA